MDTILENEPEIKPTIDSISTVSPKWVLIFREQALVEKIKIKTVFFFKADLNEAEQKALNAACDKNGNVTDTGTLGYILRHHGWLVTNLISDRQLKAQRLTNGLKRKVFTVSLNEVFILREVI